MVLNNSQIRKIYYEIKPAIPRKLQIVLRRLIARQRRRKYRDIWPINVKAGRHPEGWRGWPNNKKFALVLTHDVDTNRGEDRCLDLMKLDKKAGFKSAFYLVPGKLQKSATTIPELKENGFEVGVHSLYHDGKLFKSRAEFQKNAVLINRFLSEWGAVGFRAECMHHNLTWMHDLNILYDASTFDTDPFEPQPDSVATIFPFIVECPISGKRYVELPYSLPQDFTLFIIMQEKNTNIWKSKLDWIVANGGMALVTTHPDYMNFENNQLGKEEYSADFYAEFLAYIRHKYAGQFWNALPSEIARYWISNHSVPRD